MSILRSRSISGLTVLGFLIVAGLTALIVSTGSEQAIAANPDFPIYTINTQEVLEVHPAFQEAIQEYQSKLKELQEQIEGVEQEEQAMMQQMMQQQMQQIGVELQEEAFGAMQEDIKNFADEKGYEYIFDSNVMIVGGTDITDEVMEKIGEEAPQIDTEEPAVPGQGPVMP